MAPPGEVFRAPRDWKHELAGDVLDEYGGDETHLFPPDAVGMTILIGGFAAAAGEVSMGNSFSSRHTYPSGDAASNKNSLST